MSSKAKYCTFCRIKHKDKCLTQAILKRFKQKKMFSKDMIEFVRSHPKKFKKKIRDYVNSLFSKNGDCPICYEPILDLTGKLSFASCTHGDWMHPLCVAECLQAEHIRCPICRKNMNISIDECFPFLK